jgi:hypothetical protein
MASKEWDVHQQTFALCLLSNVVNNDNDTQSNLQILMYKRLVGSLKKYLGDAWRIGWGPVVWKQDPDDKKDGPGNAWFVARNPSLKFEDGSTYDTYVVSIASTASMYDWLVQNFGVNYVVDFSAWVSGGIDKPPQKQRGDNQGVFIAYGTADGVHHVATGPVPSGPTGIGTGTLLSFLSSLSPKGTKVIFTGMSLGGVIAPTLALAALQAGTFKSFRSEDVLVYPVAGPTPGNDRFAKLFADKFPLIDGIGYRCWNANIVNLFDVVPQVWCDNPLMSPQQNIDNVLGIWGLPPLALVVLAVIAMRIQAEVSRITYIPIRSRTFLGDKPPRPANNDEWFQTARQQHEVEYEKSIGVMIGFKHIIRNPMEG